MDQYALLKILTKRVKKVPNNAVILFALYTERDIVHCRGGGADGKKGEATYDVIEKASRPYGILPRDGFVLVVVRMLRMTIAAQICLKIQEMTLDFRTLKW